jgi:hypothetical protein
MGVGFSGIEMATTESSLAYHFCSSRVLPLEHVQFGTMRERFGDSMLFAVSRFPPCVADSVPTRCDLLISLPQHFADRHHSRLSLCFCFLFHSSHENEKLRSVSFSQSYCLLDQHGIAWGMPEMWIGHRVVNRAMGTQLSRTLYLMWLDFLSRWMQIAGGIQVPLDLLFFYCPHVGCPSCKCSLG